MPAGGLIVRGFEAPERRLPIDRVINIGKSICKGLEYAHGKGIIHRDILKNPEVAAELSEDPVRLYLREIGQVKLPDADSEFRLATMIEANRLVSAYRRRPLRKNMTLTCAIYHSLLSDTVTSWDRLLEDAERLHHETPDLGLILSESQALHAGWQSDQPSYLRAFLDNGSGGRTSSGMRSPARRTAFSWACTCFL